MKINPRQIEAFRLVYQTGSMTTAAQMLAISQPAVSRLVRDLEATLRLSLFTRSGAGISATSDAVALYSEVERSFIGLQHLQHAALAIRQKHEGFLHVAATGAFGTQCLPQAMAKLREKYPDLKVRITVTRSAEIIDMVATRRCHMGITALPTATAGIECDELPPVPVVCLLPLNHPLAAREVIDLNDLAGEVIFGPPENTALHQQIARAFTDAGLNFDLAGDCTLGASICEFVAAGAGVALLDAMAACSGGAGRLVTRPLRHRFEWHPKILYPAGVPRMRPLAQLGKAIHARLAQLGLGAPVSQIVSPPASAPKTP